METTMMNEGSGVATGSGSGAVLRWVALSEIVSGDNARTEFDEGELRELADSLRDSAGAIQPPRAWWDGERGKYVLICGERRWRAAALAGMEGMDLVVGPRPSDSDAVKWNLVENIQRSNLRPMETARRVGRMLEMTDGRSGMPLWSQGSLAEELGKSVTWIGDCVAVLRVPAAAQAALEEGRVAMEVVGLIGSLPEGMREEAVGAMIDRPFGGAMSPMEAAQYVAEHFRRDLRRADFDGEDGELVRGLPCCSGCEWWGGNREDVRGRARTSTCLNPSCYDRKAAAHAARRREAVSEEVGTTVLDAGVARGLFQPWNLAVDPSSGYVECGDKPDAYLLTESARLAARESLPTWEVLVAESEVPVKIAFDPEGRERRLMELKPAVMAALRSSRWSGLFKGESGGAGGGISRLAEALEGAGDGGDLLTAEERKERARLQREREKVRLVALVEGCRELWDGLAVVPDSDWGELLEGLCWLGIERDLQREDVAFLCRVLDGDAGSRGQSVEDLRERMAGLATGRRMALLVLVLRCRSLRYEGFDGPDWEVGAPLANLAALGGFAVKSWEGKLRRRVEGVK